MSNKQSPSIKVLVVEDNLFVQRALMRIFQGSRYDLMMVESVETALSKFRTENVPYVLTDVDLGIGPSGIDLARSIKAIDPDVKILFMSSDESNRTLVDGLGVFLLKPFSPEKLAEAIARSQSAI